MGSDYDTSDDISEYLELLDEIDRKNYSKERAGISLNNYRDFMRISS